MRSVQPRPVLNKLNQEQGQGSVGRGDVLAKSRAFFLGLPQIRKTSLFLFKYKTVLGPQITENLTLHSVAFVLALRIKKAASRRTCRDLGLWSWRNWLEFKILQKLAVWPLGTSLHFSEFGFPLIKNMNNAYTHLQANTQGFRED